MISDNDNINYYQIAKTLESAEKNFKDMEDHLKSGGKPVTSTDISNMGRCVIDGINSGIEDSVLGVSLKRASESIERMSNTLHPLSGQVKKGGK